MNGSLRAQLVRVRDVVAPRRMCVKKARYAEQWRAERVRRDRQPREKETLYVYRCPDCRGWHLTKMAQP